MRYIYTIIYKYRCRVRGTCTVETKEEKIEKSTNVQGGETD